MFVLDRSQSPMNRPGSIVFYRVYVSCKWLDSRKNWCCFRVILGTICANGKTPSLPPCVWLSLSTCIFLDKFGCDHPSTWYLSTWYNCPFLTMSIGFIHRNLHRTPSLLYGLDNTLFIFDVKCITGLYFIWLLLLYNPYFIPLIRLYLLD